MFDLAFEQYGNYDTSDNNESEILDLLNDDSIFRSFGEGLLLILKSKCKDITESNAVKIIETMCAQNGVPRSAIGSLNTMKNWFSGGPRPKKGENSRDAMFALSFAFDCTSSETAELFHKVYLDRAFDFRKAKEIVYYFCLSNKKSWEDAQRIIANIDESGDSDDGIMHSKLLKNGVDTLQDEEELLSYISRHHNNLRRKQTTAKRHLERLLENAKQVACKEAESPEYEDRFDGSWRSEETVSVNFMYTMITDQNPSQEKGTTSIFKDANFPKEIISRFPEASSFSEKEPTYESMRKMIILLFSYDFWYNVQYRKAMFDLEDYTAQLDALLSECGFCTMYYGNPFDWMFLYCTLADRPLDVFRNILLEALGYSEE